MTHTGRLVRNPHVSGVLFDVCLDLGECVPYAVPIVVAADVAAAGPFADGRRGDGVAEHCGEGGGVFGADQWAGHGG